MANQQATHNSLLKSKQHFQVLDGLRGIAALVVVIFHFLEIAISDYNKNFIAHGYLAVDFFFCLSGFVITYAYDSRIEGLGLKTFIKLRLIRLYPLVVIGSVLGLITFLADPYSELYTQYGFTKTMLLFVTSLAMIPYPVMPERFFNLFSLNAPVWSLFWEFVANLFYATLLFRLVKNWLLLLTIVAAAGIVFVAYSKGNVMGGWGGPNFFDGFFRITFSFLMGMLIYRSGWVIKNKLGLPALSALLLIAFLFPFIDKWNWLTEPILVILYLPLIVSLGAGTTLAIKHERINKFSGDLSYPLYMIHYPFIWIFLTYVTKEKPGMTTLYKVIPTGIVLLVILAYLLFKFVDQPIRKYFSSRL